MRPGNDYDVHHVSSLYPVSAMQSPPPSNPKSPPASGPIRAAECASLASLTERSRVLEALDRKLRRPLPEPLRSQCRLADVRSGRIVFLANSSTWAAKLRLYQTALLAEARVALGASVEKFAVKVAPSLPVPPNAARPKPLSQAAAAHLRTAANSLTDPELRALYLRLASLAE